MMSSQEAGAVVTGNLYLCKKNPLILIFFLFRFISCAVIDMIFFYLFIFMPNTFLLLPRAVI